MLFCDANVSEPEHPVHSRSVEHKNKTGIGANGPNQAETLFDFKLLSARRLLKVSSYGHLDGGSPGKFYAYCNLAGLTAKFITTVLAGLPAPQAAGAFRSEKEAVAA